MQKQWFASKDPLVGMLFMALGILGLAISWDYPSGTALNMGTGYVPQLLCWLLLGLGGIVVLKGVRAPTSPEEEHAFRWPPLLLIPASLTIFALTIDRWGLVASGCLLVVIGGLAQQQPRPIEIAVSAVALVAATWAIFVWGLSLPITAWPGG